MISLEQEIEKREKVLETKVEIESDIRALLFEKARIEQNISEKEDKLKEIDWDKLKEELDFLVSIARRAEVSSTPTIETVSAVEEKPTSVEVPEHLDTVESVEETSEIEVEKITEVPCVETPAEDVVETPSTTIEEIVEEPIISEEISVEEKVKITPTPTPQPKNSDPFGTVIDRINF